MSPEIIAAICVPIVIGLTLLIAILKDKKNSK